jgi:hypothetical protein
VSDREARQIIRSAIGVLCRQAGAQFAARPVIRSEPDGPTTPEPEPIAAITAARDLEHAAASAVRDHVRNAREDGCTWGRVGDVIGYRPSLRGPSAAEQAFAAFASDLGNGPAFAWTCPVCLGIVTDRGPETSPADAERGHADGCTRLAETVRAWDASWEG